MPLLGDVYLATENGVDALGIGCVVKLHGPEQVAVVGHGDGGHFLLFDHVHELLDFAGSVQQGVISVAVQVNEGNIRH